MDDALAVPLIAYVPTFDPMVAVVLKLRPEIAAAVRTVALGGRYVSKEVGEVLAKQLNRSAEKSAHETLSQREMQVFLRLAGGEKIGEIAKGMAVSVKTASTYRSRVLEKLSLGTNSELTRYAYANKLIH